jgi:hypothetical protein
MGVCAKALQNADPRVGNDELETIWCRVEYEVSAIFMLAVLQNIRAELAHSGDKLTRRVVRETALYSGAFRASRNLSNWYSRPQLRSQIRNPAGQQS